MKRMLAVMTLLFLGLTACAGGGGSGGAGAAAREMAARIDSLVAPEIEPGGPGCAVAVYRDGAIVFERGYGLADLDWSIPNSPSTRFDIASVSKQFTAACILMLAERGKLSLEDDIHRFIPESPDYGQKIEIRHLLHHTSGVRDWVWLLALGGVPFENVLSRADLYSVIMRQKALAFTPGERYQYSNSGYNLLALIVERAGGMRFEDFVSREIFEPLGMKHSLILDDRRMVVPERAFGYIPNAEGGWSMEQYFNPAMVGSSNIHTSVEDLFLWDRNYSSHTIGLSDLAEKMEERGVLNSGDTIGYACGLEVGEHRGLKTVGHQGDWAGFLASYIRFPDQNFSVVCLANTQALSPRRLCLKIADLYLADSYTAPAPSKAGPKAEARTPVAVDTTIYRDYVGVYASEDGRSLTIGRDSLGLTGFMEGGLRFELLAASEREFFLKNGEATIGFIRESDGTVSSLEWRQSGQTNTFNSLEAPLTPDPDPASLAGYAGDYYSEELKVTYHISVREGGLVLDSPIRSRYLMDMSGITGSDRLRRADKDKFRFTFLFLDFERDSRGRVSGFTLVHQWASIRLKFVKT